MLKKIILVAMLLFLNMSGCHQETSLTSMQSQQDIDYDALAAKQPKEQITEDEKGILHLADSNFMEAIAEGTVIVDFWIDNCAPCEMQTSVLESLAKDYKDQVKFAKIHVDKYQIMAQKYNVQGFPTLLVFLNGKYQGQLVGYRDAGSLRLIIDKILVD